MVTLFKLLDQAGIAIALYRVLPRFTDFAVQIRYDEQPDLQNLDRCSCNNRAESLVTLMETLPPPASSCAQQG